MECLVILKNPVPGLGSRMIVALGRSAMFLTAVFLSFLLSELISSAALLLTNQGNLIFYVR
jgi:hypothetical protein